MADRGIRRAPSALSYARPKTRSDSSHTSARGENRLRGDGGASSDEDLAKQNTDLRQRLHDEASLYRKRLDTYRQAQQNQAILVSRLQAKVLQYKQRCADLEAHLQPAPIPTHIAASSSALEQAQQHLREVKDQQEASALHEERITELDVALAHLDDERNRCERLVAQNKLLREQLEESHQTNEDLTGDLQKLTNQFEEMREEMLIKEDEWKDEEQAFNDYYSTEHNRLLNLWRDVVSIRRLFIDVQGSTERDLGRLKNDIESSAREIGCSSEKLLRSTRAESTQSLLEPICQPTQFNLENVELKSQLDLLRSQFETQTTDLCAKDDRIQELHKDIHVLEERCSDAEQSASQVLRLQDELDLLQNAFRDIAHALIQDSESKHPTEISHTSHIHLSTATPIPKSPKRHLARNVSSSAFAESTISAVQAALNKHQSVVHELQLKLQSNREQYLLVRKQLENTEGQVFNLENRLRDVVQHLDLSKAQCVQLNTDRDVLQKQYDSLKQDKSAIEKQKSEVSIALDTLSNDYDMIQKHSLQLQKEIELLHDEKTFLQTEVDRLNQDGSLREMNLRSEEDRCSRIREELLTTREELNKLYLSHDVLVQQKSEADSLIQNLEKIKGDLEMQLARLNNDRSEMHESLIKKDTQAANLEMDKRKLMENIIKLEEDKVYLQGQVNDHASDIQSLRKELLHAEQARLDLDSDRVSFSEKTKFLEIENSKIEMELANVTRDRTDLNNQLTSLSRKRDVLSDDLSRYKQKLEQQIETNGRINRNLEELVHETEEKQCTMDALDKELQRVQEQLAGVRSEKESLEAVLFDTQTNLEASEVRKSQLEHEVQELLVKEESSKGHMQRLQKDLERSEKRTQEMKQNLTSQAGTQQAEFQNMIANLKSQNDETTRKLTEERECIRSSMDKKLQQSVLQIANEKDSEIAQLVEKIENLQLHMENVIQQHEELMLRAENEKQQALLMAHHDQQALQERLEQMKRDLQEERDALDRCKRDGNAAFEQNRILVNQMKEDFAKCKGKLEEAKAQCQEEKVKLEACIADLQRDKEATLAVVQNLKVQLHVYEDKIESLNTQLHDNMRKLKEVENTGESLRKDLTDVRKQLGDCNYEKEKYHSSNKELREVIKKIEGEKRDQMRQLEESHHKLSSLEDIKMSLENERIRLQNSLREGEKDQMQLDNKLQSLIDELQRKESQNTQALAEEKELQTRLLNEVEERERAHQEVHTAKKQNAELERNLEQTRKEIAIARAHQVHSEEQWHAREQDLLVHLEDCRVKEKRLEDQKHNLEVCLVDATQQIQELKTRLTAGESRLRALDTQMGQTESAKRDVEQKLSSVVATLRRIAGVQLDGSVTPQSQRLLSPSRRWSPARANEYDKLDIAADIDPEAVRKGVRNLMQSVAQVERERDDLKMQVVASKKQMKEITDNQAKGDSKVSKVMHNLRTIQDEKGALEAKLTQKVVAYNTQAGALLKKSEEAQQLRDKVTTLELALSSSSEDKKVVDEKTNKLKNTIQKLENEKKMLQEELSRCESRLTKMELQRLAFEGDLHRLQIMVQERDAAILKQQDKADAQGRTIASLEERCSSLKSTIEQLNQSLEKAANCESELKVEVQSLQRNLIETTAQNNSGAERLKHIQLLLGNAENDKKIVAERYDNCQQTLVEVRRNYQILQDQVGRLNNDLANCEVQRSGLESQLRLAQCPTISSVGSHHEEELLRQLQGIQRERNELRGKVESLNNKVRQIESENRQLERLIAKTPRSKSYERQEKYELDSSHSDRQTLKYEQENRELRLKIQKLETELADKDAELSRLRIQIADSCKYGESDAERYRAAQLQAERLLDAREQSHRQQVQRLEQQVNSLREQLNMEIKRRQQYIMQSSRAGREMQQLRQALGDSLRTVSQDPSLDALLLEQEARKLDHTARSTASLPAGTVYDRSTPQPPY